MVELLLGLVGCLQSGNVEISSLSIQFTLHSCDLPHPVHGSRSLSSCMVFTSDNDVLDELWCSPNLSFLDDLTESPPLTKAQTLPR